MKYRAASLNDIANHFDGMAASANKKASAMAKKTGKEFHVLRAEIGVWIAAAEMLRNTEIGVPEIPAKR